MIITTTPTVEGKRIKAYLGLVGGADLYNAGGLIGGGYSTKGQSMYFRMAVEAATRKMEENSCGADAIVGVQISIGSSAVANQVIVTVTGTAVTLEDANDDELPDL